MENRPYALSAGLFLLLLCIGLIVVAVRMSGSPTDQVTFVVESKLPVSGLNLNAPVRLRGVDIGTVKKIHFSPADPNLILIDIAVDEDAPLTKGTYAKLNYLGITGLSFIQLDNDAARPEKLASNAGPPAHIELRPSLLDEVSGSGEELLREASQAAKRVNALLSDQNLSELATTLSNLKTASAKIAGVADDLQPAAEGLSTIVVRTTTTMRKIDPLLDNLNRLTQEARARVIALDNIGKSAEDIGQTSRALEETVPELRVVLNNFVSSLRTVDRVLSGIEQQPQSLLFGRIPVTPGPGEDGFSEPSPAPAR
jgi:phospholipid/cholesterol/gamma-HCH transport system substrate-binding protein